MSVRVGKRQKHVRRFNSWLSVGYSVTAVRVFTREWSYGCVGAEFEWTTIIATRE